MQIKFTYTELFDEMFPTFSKVFYKASKDYLSGRLNSRACGVLERNATTDKPIIKTTQKITLFNNNYVLLIWKCKHNSGFAQPRSYFCDFGHRIFNF